MRRRPHNNNNTMGMEPDYETVPGEEGLDPENAAVPSSFYGTGKKRPHPLIQTRSFNFRRRVIFAIFVVAAIALSIHLGIRRGHIQNLPGEYTVVAMS